MKKTIRLTESELKGLIKENIKKVLKEYQNYEDRPEEIGKLENYFHFRKIESQNKKDMIDMGKAVFDFSFLDSLSDDNLKGAWSIQTDSAKTVCNIRSLVWNGYFAYHKANTNLFGSVYIGYGIKNMDIPFMQQ